MSETVHAVYNYHDGPLSDVADFRGAPHVFENAYFEEATDRWSDVSLLRKIDPQVFAWALEERRILLRWRQAFEQGEATLADYPALPQERLRDRELSGLLREHRHVDEKTAEHRVRGKFERDESRSHRGTTAQYRVQWILLP